MNWKWLKSLIGDYRAKKISREKFVGEWRNAQETLEGLGYQRNQKKSNSRMEQAGS